MSFPGAVHTCDLQEFILAEDDLNEATREWANYATGVPCRAYNVAGGYAETGGESEKFISSWRAMLPYGQTVTEANRIANVRDKRGTTLITSASIHLVNHDPGAQMHHKELVLTEVRTH